MSSSKLPYKEHRISPENAVRLVREIATIRPAAGWIEVKFFGGLWFVHVYENYPFQNPKIKEVLEAVLAGRGTEVQIVPGPQPQTLGEKITAMEAEGYPFKGTRLDIKA